MRRIPALAVFLFLVPALAAATVTLNAGTQSFTLEGSNATVHINVTMNVSHVDVHPKLVELGDGNLSVRNTTKNRTTLNLHAWDPSAGDGNVAVNFSANTTDGHNVTFAVGGLKTSTDYFLDRDGTRQDTLTTDGNGNLSFFNSDWVQHTFVLTPNTTADSSGSDDEEDDGSGGGSGSTTTTSTVDHNVTVERLTGLFHVTVDDASANTTISIRLFRNKTSDDPGFGVDELGINVRKDGDYGVNVTRSTAAPAETDAFNGSRAERTVGYLRLDHTFTADTMNNGTIRFRVDPDKIETQPGNIDLRRFQDGAWNTLTTRYGGFDGQYHEYTADTPGFSTFAIAERRPRIRITGTWLAPANATAGDAVTVTAAVANDGSATGNTTVTVDIANTTQEETVSVAPDATTNVTFIMAMNATGVHPVTVNGAEQATLTVAAQEEASVLGSIVLFLIAVIILAAGIASVYLYREPLLAAAGIGEEEQALERRFIEVREHIKNLERRNAVPQPDRVVDALDRAEDALNRGDEAAARHILDDLDHFLSGDEDASPRF